MQCDFKLLRDCGFSQPSEFKNDRGESFTVPARHKFNSETTDGEPVRLTVNTPSPLPVKVGDVVICRIRRFKTSSFGDEVTAEYVGLQTSKGK